MSSNKSPTVGIALSGGIVRGFVHLGVLQVLDESDIPLDIVGGSSVGALIGYLMAAGLSLSEIDQLSSDLGWGKMASPIIPFNGLVSFEKLERWLVELLGDLYFEDLVRPFVVSATDMETCEPYSINSGRVAPAVRASCSVPGFVAPTWVEGHLLADGGVTKNTPGEAVRAMGADYVIGVDVFYPSNHRVLGPLRYGLRAVEMMVQRSGNGREETDCLIIPELGEATFFDFRQREALIAAGRTAAEAKLEEIHRELAALPAFLESHSAQIYAD